MAKIYKMLANKSNYGSERSLDIINSIIIHGSVDENFNGAAGFQKNDLKKSVHYFVNKRSIHAVVEDKFVAYSVGCRAEQRNEYSDIKNSTSISIMVNPDNADAMEIAAELIASKMHEYNITIDRVVRHFDINNFANCPSALVDEANWEAFKKNILKYYNAEV